MNCDNAKACTKQLKCTYINKLKKSDIYYFFDQVGTCDTRIVYLNINKEEVVIDKLFVKNIRQNNNNKCNLCFRKKGSAAADKFLSFIVFFSFFMILS